MEASGIRKHSVSNWRGLYLNLLVSYDPDSFWDCVVHGIGYLLPLYVVVFAAGILFEVVFASKRGHEVNEGFFVTSILYTLTLPPDILTSIGRLSGLFSVWCWVKRCLAVRVKTSSIRLP